MFELINTLSQPALFWVLLTLGVFITGGWLQGKTGWPIFNPLLFSVVVIMAILLIVPIELPQEAIAEGLSRNEYVYNLYNVGGQYISIWLNPATVSLAILAERNWETLRDNAVAIGGGITIGVIIHAILVVVIAALTGVEESMTASLVVKSITTAVATPVSAALGGNASLTVAFTVLACLLGSVIGEPIFKMLNITNPVAQGAGLGGSSAAMGVGSAIKLGEKQGSVASASLVVAAIITTIVAPLTMNLLGFMF